MLGGFLRGRIFWVERNREIDKVFRVVWGCRLRWLFFVDIYWFGLKVRRVELLRGFSEVGDSVLFYWCFFCSYYDIFSFSLYFFWDREFRLF